MKISQKVNISRDLILILAEYKNGRLSQIVPDRRRIGRSLIIKGFRYAKNKISYRRIYYGCVNSDCKAKLTTNIYAKSKLLNISFDEYHSHEPDYQFVAESNFRELSFEILQKHPTESLKSIHKKTIAATENSDFCPLNTEKKAIYLAREKKCLPPNPQKILDVTIDGS